MHDFQTAYFNKADNQVLGVASAVVHNAEGQTLQFTTATIGPASGGNATA
jgi:F420-0:gamma-glutamyl ligase